MMRPRLRITMPTKSKPISLQQPTSPANNYMLAVPSLDPRPLQELQNERSYLLYSLQKQGDRATCLFHRYAAVETHLTGADTTPETKKCKKEAALIKIKIAESTQQEQLILLRLSEIHVELQNRDRWMMVHHQPLLQPPPLVYPPPPMSAVSLDLACEVWPLSPCQEHEREQEDPLVTGQSSGYFSCPPTSDLSPLSPCFTPGVVFAEDIWSRASKTSAEKKTTATEDRSAFTFTPTGSVDEGGAAGSQKVCRQRHSQSSQSQDRQNCVVEGRFRRSHHQEDQREHPETTANHKEDVRIGEDSGREQRPTLSPSSAGYGHVDGTTNSGGWDADPESDAAGEEDSQAPTSKPRRVSLYLPLPLSHKAAKDRGRKRLSLPYLKGIWPRSRSNSIQSNTAA